MMSDGGELQAIKNYLRIDGDYDDALLGMLVTAGKVYFVNAGIPESDDPLYRLALALYVGIHYENRDGAQKIDGLSYALQSIILQLKTS